MKNHWDESSEIEEINKIANTSELCGKDPNDIDWKAVRKLSKEDQKKIRDKWEENNPLPNYSDMVPAIEQHAKNLIRDHARHTKCEDGVFQVWWDKDWIVSGKYYSSEEDKAQSYTNEEGDFTVRFATRWVPDETDMKEMFDFVDVAYAVGNYPESNNHMKTEIDQMTDEQVLTEKMGLTQKQVEYVLMLQDAKKHLNTLEILRSQGNCSASVPQIR